jgi:predicted transglutaminase-like protease
MRPVAKTKSYLPPNINECQTQSHFCALRDTLCYDFNKYILKLLYGAVCKRGKLPTIVTMLISRA